MESYERSSSSSGSVVSALLITEQEKYSSSTTSSLPPLCRGSQASMMVSFTSYACTNNICIGQLEQKKSACKRAA